VNEEINYYATEFRNSLITRSLSQPRRIKEQEKGGFFIQQLLNELNSTKIERRRTK
jgi:hypothetical protein